MQARSLRLGFEAALPRRGSTELPFAPKNEGQAVRHCQKPNTNDAMLGAGPALDVPLVTLHWGGAAIYIPSMPYICPMYMSLYVPGVAAETRDVSLSSASRVTARASQNALPAI